MKIKRLKKEFPTWVGHNRKVLKQLWRISFTFDVECIYNPDGFDKNIEKLDKLLERMLKQYGLEYDYDTERYKELR